MGPVPWTQALASGIYIGEVLGWVLGGILEGDWGGILGYWGDMGPCLNKKFAALAANFLLSRRPHFPIPI